ncbi:MAG TPA: AMP-binding protein [Thermoanaerobaculia bacterium]|nr:AMP-binding protein [Thermoanaerobaculia bacterium]
MVEATDLPSIVLARAGESPEEPALFFPEEMDVRWRSWGALAAQVAGGAEALAELGLPAGECVAFRWRPEPDAVAADLAIQAAGLVSVPILSSGAGAPPAGAAPEPGTAARLLLPGESAPEGGGPAPRLPEAVGPGRGPRRGREGKARGDREPPPPACPGGAWVLDGEPPEAPGAPRRGAARGAGDLLARARDLEERLERAVAGAAAVVSAGRRGPGAGEREIALGNFDLRYADGRTFLAWALATGAALLLEPDPRVLPGAAAWARPTLVAGEARPLGELGRRVRSLEAERPRLFRRRSRSVLPFGRLRLLLVLGTGRLAVDDVAFWAGRGVAVVRVRA